MDRFDTLLIGAFVSFLACVVFLVPMISDHQEEKITEKYAVDIEQLSKDRHEVNLWMVDGIKQHQAELIELSKMSDIEATISAEIIAKDIIQDAEDAAKTYYMLIDKTKSVLTPKVSQLMDILTEYDAMKRAQLGDSQ